ncbi:MAG: RDD family protein [Pseudomonadota bacterium]|nr:RDD family protein [Pseudomonadota bacterium]
MRLSEPPLNGRTEGLIDTLRIYETPEGVDLELRVAGPVVRAAALAIDSLIKGALILALTPLLAFSGLGVGLMLLGMFLLGWFYPVFFELRNGATPGKRAMGLAVIHGDGTPVGPAASVIRNLLRVVDFLPLFYCAGLVSTLIDGDFRRLGDLAAGTLVIHVRPPFPEREIPLHEPVPPPRPLTPETQQAIIGYAERSGRLSSERRVELAEALAWLSARRGHAAEEAVLGYANWLTRGQ